MKKLGYIFVIVGLLALAWAIFWGVNVWQEANSKISFPMELIPQPTPTIYPSAVTVIEQVQSLSRLETASYHIEKVITAETGQGPLGFLFGDKVLLVAYGQVIAGVDLGRLGPEDVLVNGDGTIYLRLPPSEVFVATLDNARTYVYDRQTGVAGLNPQLETAARLEAEQLILQAALEDGLLDQADKNARDFMRSLLAVMGFKHTLFVEVLPTPTPSPSPSPTLTPTPAP